MAPIRPQHSLARPVRAAELVAGVYDRVSRADAHNRYRSVDEQHVENSAACAENGWLIGERYSDPNISASRYSKKVRENWDRLLADLMAGKFQVLVLWESSRGDRNAATWLSMLALCQEHGVLIHITSHGHTYNMEVRRDWKTLADEGIDSENEARMTSGRVNRDVKSGATAGRPHGMIPYGYVRIYSDKTGQLAEQSAHPVHADVVREIIRSVAQAVPIATITRSLNARGIPAPRGKEWPREAVRRIALNATYIAKRSYRGELLDGEWAPLIDEATFYAAQQILTDPTRVTTRPGRQKYLLSFLAQCDVCGGWLRVAPVGAKQPHASYRCYANACPRVAIPMAVLDRIVDDAICVRMSEPAPYRNLMQANDSAAMQARADVGRWNSDRAQYKALAKAGRMDPADLAEMLDDLREKIKAAELRLERAAMPLAAQELADVAAAARAAGRPVLADVRKRWESYEMPARRNIVRNMCTVRLAPATVDPARAGGRYSNAADDRDYPAQVNLAWLVN